MSKGLIILAGKSEMLHSDYNFKTAKVSDCLKLEN